MPGTRDRDLLRRAGAGDRDAFAAFYRAHAELVLAFMLVRTGDPHASADLASETFARALEAWRSGRVIDVPARWLFGIARNLFADSFRARRVESRARERLELPRLTIGEEDPERIVELVDLLRGGTPALDRLDILPERQRGPFAPGSSTRSPTVTSRAGSSARRRACAGC